MICPRCSATIPDGASFCNVCGAQLSAQPPSQAQAQAPMGSAAPQGPAPASAASPAAQGAMPQGAAPMPMPQGGAPQGYAPQGAAPMPQGSPQGFAPQGAVPQGFPPQGATPQGFTPQGAAPAPAPVPQGAAPAPAPAAPAKTKKGLSPVVYGLIAGAVVLAMVLAMVLIPSGGGQSAGGDSGTDGTPTDTQPVPPESSDPTGDGGSTDPSTQTNPIEAEYSGVHFTVPAGWVEKEIDDGVDYSFSGDGSWADVMVFSIGSSDGFDAERWLEDKTEWFGYMSTAEVLNAKTTTVSGYPTAYMEIAYHNDGADDGYEMLICMDTPSGNLVEMSGTCLNDNGDMKDQLHSIADTLSIS